MSQVRVQKLRMKAALARGEAARIASTTWPGRNAGAVRYDVECAERRARKLEQEADALEATERHSDPEKP